MQSNKQIYKLCAHPGCGKLLKVGETYCEAHQKDKTRNEAGYSARRGTAAARGYGSNWTKVREQQLRRRPLCESCGRKGKTKVANVVHHKDEDQFNNEENNLVSLCRECHEILHGRKVRK